MKKLEKLGEFRLKRSALGSEKMQKIQGGAVSGGWDSGTCTNGGDCQYIKWNEAGEPIDWRMVYSVQC